MATTGASEAGTALHGRPIITVCAMMATLMQALDSTVANVALPYMQGSLSATADQITWVLTSYIVAAAIMTAPVGWLATRYGRKRLFIAGLAGFTIASMLCGLATSLEEIVAFRILQGMFGAVLVPLSQTTMLDIYPPERRGSAMAIWGMGVMVGPILGPTLGGYLTDLYDWRWVFYVNVPFGIAAVAGMLIFLPETERKPLKFDWIGFATLSLGIGALQMMLDRGQQKDWFGSGEIVTEAVLAGLGLYWFIVHLLTAEKPFITPRIFRDVNLSMSMLMMFTIGMVLLASAALLAPYLQTLAGYPVLTAGLLMAPRGLGTMIAMMIAGRMANRVEPRLLMLLGILTIGATMWQMTGWTPDVDERTLVISTIVQGFGLGLVFTPLQVVAFATLEAHLRTEGTALLSLVRNIGMAIGISITSLVREQGIQVMHSELAGEASRFNRVLQSGPAHGPWNLHTTAGLSALDQAINQQASIVAYINDFKLMTLVCVPAILLLLFMRRPAAPAGPAAIAAVMD
jgi:DHA2 family multidrug resistance protein